MRLAATPLIAEATRAAHSLRQSIASTAAWVFQLALSTPKWVANRRSLSIEDNAASCVDTEAPAAPPGAVVSRSAEPIRLPPARTVSPPEATSGLWTPSAAAPASTEPFTVSAAVGAARNPGSRPSTT